MYAQTLLTYFETETQQRIALDRVVKKGWLDPAGNLNLYEASWRSFNSSLDAGAAFQHFEKIYGELRGPNWQVFRSSRGSAGSWTPEQIFETIRREFADFSWRSPVNLRTFLASEASARLQRGLANMRGIKPNKYYPLMTVSKFLHFYNPALFPIYDTEVIWKMVFSRFRHDFRVFCQTANIAYDRAINDGTEAFLLHYMRWASSLLSTAHARFMEVFVDWLALQPGTNTSRDFDLATLYATAFEFTAIGAAVK